MNDEQKKEILDCSMEIQRCMFKQMSPKIAFTELKKRFSEEVIEYAFQMLEQAREHSESPYQGMTETITRCMSNLSKDDDTEFATEEKFFKLCERAYKEFMNDEEGRGMPLVFLYSKGVTQLGVAPIITDGESSPMDHLKKIVYQASPDAYCFCAEGSMLVKDKNEKIEYHKYGDIINDKDSQDIMFIQGNNKLGTKQFLKSWKLSGKTGSLKFEEFDDMKDMSKVESEKIP